MEQEETAEELIFSVGTHSSKELRHFKFLCVSFMAQLLGSGSFVSQVGDVSARTFLTRETGASVIRGIFRVPGRRRRRRRR